MFKEALEKEVGKVIKDTDEMLFEICTNAIKEGKLGEYLNQLDIPEDKGMFGRKTSKTLVRENALVNKLVNVSQDNIKMSDACYVIGGMAQKRDPRFTAILKSFNDKDCDDAVEMLYDNVKKLIEDYLELKAKLESIAVDGCDKKTDL